MTLKRKLGSLLIFAKKEWNCQTLWMRNLVLWRDRFVRFHLLGELQTHSLFLLRTVGTGRENE